MGVVTQLYQSVKQNDTGCREDFFLKYCALCPGAPWNLDPWILVNQNPAPSGLFLTGASATLVGMTQAEPTTMKAYFEAFLVKDEKDHYAFTVDTGCREDYMNSNMAI